MEHFFSVIKVFIEKHLIPTISSVVLTVLTILLFPSLSAIQNKTGQVLFWFFVFCCWFLVIHFAIWFVKRIKSKLWLAEQNEKRIKEAIENINSFYDQLSKDEKAIILTFVQNKNLPLRVRQVETFDGILSNKMKIFSISSSLSDAKSKEGEYWHLPAFQMLLSMGRTFEYDNFYFYKLKDDAYHDLKLAFDQQGKLGNF